MFIIIVFRLGCHRPSGGTFFYSCPLYFFPYSPLSSVRLRLSHCLNFILAVPMRECLGKHSCMSSLFPIAILNGTSSFLSLVQENINMPSIFFTHFTGHVFILFYPYFSIGRFLYFSNFSELITPPARPPGSPNL